MSKHNPETARIFAENMNGCEKMSEADLQDKIKATVLTVEHDESYSTKELLKIYSLIASLSNCAEKDRKKYVNKVKKLL